MLLYSKGWSSSEFEDLILKKKLGLLNKRHDFHQNFTVQEWDSLFSLMRGTVQIQRVLRFQTYKCSLRLNALYSNVKRYKTLSLGIVQIWEWIWKTSGKSKFWHTFGLCTE